jgi:hypothetical protein
MVHVLRFGQVALPAWLLLWVAGLSGCGGPKFYPVSGTVTMDGKPLADAMVVFIPESTSEGRFAQAKTDDNGRYVLMQTTTKDGALAGKYKVSISTFIMGIPEFEPPVPSIPETVPDKYNDETTLTVEVKPGEPNVFDFDLDSEGTVTQPEIPESAELD